MKAIRLILLFLTLLLTTDYVAAQRVQQGLQVSVRELDKSSTKSSLSSGDVACVRELDKSSTNLRASGAVQGDRYVVGTRAYTEGSLEATDDWVAARSAAATSGSLGSATRPVCYTAYELTNAEVSSTRRSGMVYVTDWADGLRLFARLQDASVQQWIVRDANGQTVHGRVFLKFDGVDGEAKDRAAPPQVVCYATSATDYCLPATAQAARGNVPAKYNPGKGRGAVQDGGCGDTCPAETVTLTFSAGAVTYVALDPTPIYMSINDRASSTGGHAIDSGSSRLQGATRYHSSRSNRRGLQGEVHNEGTGARGSGQ